MALYPDIRFHFNSRVALCGVISAFVLVGCPLAGVYLAGMSVEGYLQFPPKTVCAAHAANNKVVFLIGLFLGGAFVTPFILRFLKFFGKGMWLGPSAPFPKWGLWGLGLLLVSWGISWDFLHMGQSVRDWSFTPLWIGFIIFINGVTKWRLGTCLLTRRPQRFLLLFMLSSFFWWYFEFINRFVKNWYYVGVSSFGPWRYFFMASLSFSTVLPAVMSMNELLKSVTVFDRAYRFEPKNCSGVRKRYVGIFLYLSCFLMFLIGLYPDYLFPLVWVAPLLVLCSLRLLMGLENLFYAYCSGNVGPMVRLATSGLICGFFWEMWNYLSYPKWIYSIPFVGQCKIFEMPILGYLGYLPFGLECAAVSTFIIPLKEILYCTSKACDMASK